MVDLPNGKSRRENRAAKLQLLAEGEYIFGDFEKMEQRNNRNGSSFRHPSGILRLGLLPESPFATN